MSDKEDEKTCFYCGESLSDDEDGVHDNCADYLNFWDVYEANNEANDDNQ